VAFIYRTFLVLVVVTISWFSYQKHVESRDRSIRVQDLRDCFQRREFAPTQPPAAVQAHFFQALVRLHEAMLAERSLGWWRNKEINLDWYIHEGLAELEANPEEASLIGRALQAAYYDLQRNDVLALSDSRESLLRGRPPHATHGIFDGDPLVIGFQISPVIIPHLRNHPANFVLQPAPVWALQQDIIDAGNLGLVRQFHNAGLIPDPLFQALNNQFRRPSTAQNADKND